MRRNYRLRGLGHVLAAAALAILATLLVYVFAVGPWQMRYGATDAEVSRTLPGDELTTLPQNQTTRAITIDAPATGVWPWLVQMGQGRGGLYSYETLENLIGCDMHNSDTIVSAWQDTAVGDRVRMYPEGSGPPPYTVARIVPGQALILGHTTEPGGVPSTVTPQTQWGETWSFILQPINEQSTRLIIRGRSTYSDPVMGAIMSAVAPGYFLMERGMLSGIKERAERAAGLQSNATAADGWGAAFLLSALLGLVAYLFAGRWPQKLVILPLGSAIWVLALFFGYPSAVIAALIALMALAALVWNYLPIHASASAPIRAAA